MKKNLVQVTVTLSIIAVILYFLPKSDQTEPKLKEVRAVYSLKMVNSFNRPQKWTVIVFADNQAGIIESSRAEDLGIKSGDVLKITFMIDNTYKISGDTTDIIVSVRRQ